MQPTSQIFAGSSHVLLRPWHQGGRLELYEAEHLRHGERRLVLLAPPETLTSARSAEAWLDGARAATALRHPYLLRLAAAGLTEEGGAYAAYRIAPHRTARHILEQSGPLSLELTCDVALCVLSALQLAHASGFLHGAVGLDTVLLAPDPNTDPPALLLGLGPCAAIGAQPTPHCPPERLAGAPLTERSDLYSVAVLMVSLLAPEAEGAAREWVKGASIPDALKDTLLSALDREPHSRQPTARLLANELRCFAGNSELFQLRLQLPPLLDEPQSRTAIHPKMTVRSEPSDFGPNDEPARERLRAAVVPLPPTLPQLAVPHTRGSRPKLIRLAQERDEQQAVPGPEQLAPESSLGAPAASAGASPAVLIDAKFRLGSRPTAFLAAAGFSVGIWLAWLSGLI